MEPAVRERIFEAFFTTKEVTEQAGLWVSHEIIVKHEGWCMSAAALMPGKGVRRVFQIFIPDDASLTASASMRLWHLFS